MDDHLFPTLDLYLQELHAGRTPDRDQVLFRHPDAAALLECLEALDRLAVPANGPAETAVTDFDQYEILEELGRGGMGVVYKARQKGLDRLVAIKTLLTGRFASEEQVRRFAAEARAAARLEHPHVVRVYAAGAVHGQHYLVMEYVAGRSLADLLGDGPPGADAAARCLSAVADAVEHLHAHGIIHRDLKPSNILLGADGHPYVTDFGIAKLLQGGGPQTVSGVIVGTPSYMPPEQAAGHVKEVGPRSDVYSLGAVLYEMLTGRPPFREESPLDTLVQVIEGEPEPPRRLNPLIPRDLEAVCLKCLEKDPAARYSSAAALAADLRRFLAGEEVAARPPGVGQRLRAWARREPALATRLAALPVFAAVAQVNYLLMHHEPLAVHAGVMAGLGLWAAASVAFQFGLRRGLWPDVIRCAWVSTDLALLTALLILTRNQTSPLLVCYPLVVGGAGLWFRTGLVWFTTAAAAVAYAVLILAQPPSGLWHHHVLFLIALAVLGVAVAYQVRRVRALSRYYEQRPLP
jgi:serine/threonine-protein kinase